MPDLPHKPGKGTHNLPAILISLGILKGWLPQLNPLSSYPIPTFSQESLPFLSPFFGA